MSRAYSFLEIKALDDEQRLISGWASRVEPDRAADVVEPRGAEFKLPLPLLLDHDHVRAVGDVIEATVTDAGIRFKARIAKIAEPGAMKDLCDSAWAAAKAGLRRAVSIGFRPLRTEPLANGGTRFLAWDWFELSMVSVPCAPGATIDQIKSLDRNLRAKHPRGRVVRLGTPAKAHRVVKLDMPAKATTTNERCPVSSAILSATDEFERALEIAKHAKTLGSTEALLLRTQAEAALATDDALAELRARLAKLEGKR